MRENTRPNVVRRAKVAAAIGLALIALAEVGLRLAEPHLPEPAQWPSAEAAAKLSQIGELSATGEIDVIFVGSSVVAEGIDPLAYNDSSGRIAYNAALSAASMRATELWVRDVVLQETDPSIVVIGVSGRDLNDNGISQTEFYERLTNSPGYIDRRKPANPLEHVESWFLQHSALVRLRPILRDPAAIVVAQNPGQPGSEDEPDIGAFGSDVSATSGPYTDFGQWRMAWLARHLNDYSIGNSETEALGRLIETLIAHDIEVLLVNMPVTADYVETLPDGRRDMQELDLILEDIASAAGVEYLDASAQYEKTDFRDPAHLTPEASSMFARRIANEARVAGEPSEDL